MESMIIIDIPIQMIFCTDTDGKITPLRFRFQNKNNELITIDVSSVDTRQLEENKALAKFVCSANMYGIRKTFVLTYNLCLHQWKMVKISA